MIVKNYKGNIYDVSAIEYRENEGVYGILPHGREILLSDEQWDEKKEKSLTKASLQFMWLKLAEAGELLHDFGETTDLELREAVQARRGKK